jgi:hypothetical protein
MRGYLKFTKAEFTKTKSEYMWTEGGKFWVAEWGEVKEGSI